MKTRKQVSSGMSPDMTKEKPRKRRKPKPYKAPLSIQNYYNGVACGIDLMKDGLLELVNDEEIKQIIKTKAHHLKISSTQKLREFERQKTKDRTKEWEEKEWLGL